MSPAYHARTLPRYRWRPLTVLLLVGLSLSLVFAQQRGESRRGSGSSTGRASDDACSVAFAESYSASIATTMPMADHPPVAQTGRLYVDRAAGKVRIDQFVGDQRTSFLVDNRRLRGFLFFGHRHRHRAHETNVSSDNAGDGGGANKEEDDVTQRCHMFYLPQKVTPFCVPRRYVMEPRPAVIRGVPVTQFKGMEGFAGMPLVEQSVYVLNSSTSDGAGEAAATASFSFVPWRLEFRARPDMEPHKIGGVPYTPPNWRFFGHPMFDELVLSPAQENQLQLWQPSVDLLTIDFYDYDAAPLDEDEVFGVPSQCTALLQSETASGNATGSSASRGGAHSENASDPRLELATIQRFLLQWHLLQDLPTAKLQDGGAEWAAGDL